MANQTPAPPPYVSYGVFKSTITTLAESVVPTSAIDRRVLDGLSGADYGALMSALRFLGLADDDRRATQSYRDLVGASKDPAKFKSVWGKVIEERYRPTAGSVDIKHGTITELERAFREAGVSQGQMLTKTIRFYVKALQDVGIEPSPHITKPKKTNGARRTEPRQRTPREREEREKPKDQGDRGGTEGVLPGGFERLPIPGLPGAHIQYPDGVTEANCDLFDAMMVVLRTYAKGLGGSKEKKP